MAQTDQQTHTQNPFKAKIDKQSRQIHKKNYILRYFLSFVLTLNLLGKLGVEVLVYHIGIHEKTQLYTV